MNEFDKTYGKSGLIPDSEAIQETVEIGLSFERAESVRRLPAVRGVAVPMSAGSVLPEKK